MHHWRVGETINIGWPDYGIPERTYTIVNFDLLGEVFRARVTNGHKDCGFLVVYDCHDVVLEMQAEQASQKLDFRVIVSNLRCSVDGTLLRSFDYEWYSYPEDVERASLVARTIVKSSERMRQGP